MITLFYIIQMQHNLVKLLEHKIQLRIYTQFIEHMINLNLDPQEDSIMQFLCKLII